MRPALPPRKKARKKNRKKVDRTKTRFQSLQGTPELAKALIAGEDMEILVTPKLMDDLEELLEDPEDFEEESGEDKLLKEPDGIEDAPLPGSESSNRPEPEDN